MLYDLMYTKKTWSLAVIWTYTYVDAWHEYQTIDRGYFLGGVGECVSMCMCVGMCMCVWQVAWEAADQ